MKVAYFSPLSPQKSGVVDYSEKELLPFLSKYADIDIFIDNTYNPSNTEIIKKFNVHKYDEFDERVNDYDMCVYQLGNNPLHEYIYNTILKYPGLVVLNDIFLHGLLWNRTIAKGIKQKYIEEFEYCYGENGRKIAESAIRYKSYPDFEYPLLKRIIDNSIGVITHSEYAKRTVLKECPKAIVKTINLPVEENNCNNFNESVVGFDFDQETIIVSSFGYIFPHKRLNIALKAFKQFQKYFPNSLYLIVGEQSTHYNLNELINELSLKESVIKTGFVKSSEISSYIQISDIFINLRYPTAGETSSSLLKIMAAEKPVIVSNVGWFCELPNDCCAKVDVNDNEELLLLEYLKILAQNEKLRTKMGNNAKKYVLNYHNPERTAYEYNIFIRKLLYNQKTPILKEVAYEMADIGITENDDYIIKDISLVLKDLNLF